MLHNKKKMFILSLLYILLFVLCFKLKQIKRLIFGMNKIFPSPYPIGPLYPPLTLPSLFPEGALWEGYVTYFYLYIKTLKH